MKKTILFPLLLVCFATSAFAYGASTPPQLFDINVIAPVNATTFYSHRTDTCIDFNIQVFDSNAAAPVHYANIYYEYSDGNRFMATDVNLGSTNCYFHGVSNVWTTGADCHIQYCFSTFDIATGDYVLDVNVANKTPQGVRDYNKNVVMLFSVNTSPLGGAARSAMQNIPLFLGLACVLVCAGLFVFREEISPTSIILAVAAMLAVVVSAIVIAAAIV